ncbi:MAG: hypothetical protein U5K76_14585 [Woeseiaceae bacterium]|nr:hypothetical protein [Woeseiaceae bacterium]
MADPHDNDAEERRTRIRRSALLFGAIALVFYLGFIAVTGLSG